MLLDGCRDIEIEEYEEARALRVYNYIHLCREFGWTYQQLMDTPQHFIDDLMKVSDLANAKQKAKNEQQ